MLTYCDNNPLHYFLACTGAMTDHKKWDEITSGDTPREICANSSCIDNWNNKARARAEKTVLTDRSELRTYNIRMQAWWGGSMWAVWRRKRTATAMMRQTHREISDWWPLCPPPPIPQSSSSPPSLHFASRRRVAEPSWPPRCLVAPSKESRGGQEVTPD